MFDAGVGRVVIGSLAVKRSATVRALLDEFGGDRITLALDVRLVDGAPMVAIRGWTETSRPSACGTSPRPFPQRGICCVTDIGRDGMLDGPNFALDAEASRAAAAT